MEQGAKAVGVMVTQGYVGCVLARTSFGNDMDAGRASTHPTGLVAKSRMTNKVFGTGTFSLWI